MGYSSLSSQVVGAKLRLLPIVAAVLLALAVDARPAPAQSCVGMVAGQVCRPAAGGCDVAESCVSTGGAGGAALYQPVDGNLGTDVGWNYNMGYAFTPKQTMVVTYLGGFFNGTKTVYLYNRTTGAVLASATVTAANGWAYAPIAPVTLDKFLPYSVAVNLAGSGGAYRTGMTSMPASLTDATIDGTCYVPASTAEPCAFSGLFTSAAYGMADIKYLTIKPFYQPTDGTLYTDVNGDYMAGYAFTPNKNLIVTHLGGLYNGTKTVYLFNRSTGAVLASVSNTSANAWIYTRLPPITLSAGTSYTVAVRTGNSGAYRGGMTSMPSVVADAAIEGSCYRPASDLEPCASSGLVSGNDYGLVDIKYAPLGGGLACPADTFVPSGSVCRAATGTCDVAESCSGSSPACPANAFVPAGLSCNDGQACTFNDACNGAGGCGGTTVTCGGGNACSTTVCNGTSTCESARVFCMNPPGECYNTLGTCSTTNGSCSYTVKVGAPCGSRGTCLSDGSCNTPLQPTSTATQACPTPPPTVPAPTPIGCDSCDASRPCVVDADVVVPVEYQTCSGYTPRKGDVVLHEAQGLTQLMLKPFGSPWTHVGVFLDPKPWGSWDQNKQMVVHHALNQNNLPAAVLQANNWDNFLIGLKLDKNAAYCKSAKINPATLLDQGGFAPGVPNLHQGDMTTEPDGAGGLFWDTGVDNRAVVIAANRAAGEQVADQMLARVGQEYYSLNSLVDDAKGRARLSNGKPGTNCASALMSCITPSPPRTFLATDKMRTAANIAYDRIRKQIRHMAKTEDSVSFCKNFFGCWFGAPCPVDCDGLAWEVSNGIADQVIACILFGPTANGCECTRDNRKWHYAAWANAPYSPPTQDDIDWVNGRMTDYEFVQDPWTGSASQGQPTFTVYPSYTYFPDDFLDTPTYPSSNLYDLKRIANAHRRYGHCYTPLGLTATGSPAYSYVGQPISWHATATGGQPASIRYAFFRRIGGPNAPWVPDVGQPSWQTSPDYTWTPTASDVGTWETYVWVKDGQTPSNMNGYGYAAGTNTGPVQIVTVPTLALNCSPMSVNCGTAGITCTATASGGVPSTRQFAFFRRRGGTSNWIPDPYSPAWQGGNVYTWTPTCSDVADWELYAWVRDSATPASMSGGYGYAAGVHGGVAHVTSNVLQNYPPKGWVDGFNSQHVWGWACDPDYPTDTNRVDFWTISGQGLGSSGAYFSSNAGVTSACGGGTAHGFDWWPSGGIASGTHFNVYSIDLPYGSPGNDNRRIGGSGATGDGYEFVIP